MKLPRGAFELLAAAAAGLLAGGAARILCEPSSGWEPRAFGGTWLFDFFSGLP